MRARQCHAGDSYGWLSAIMQLNPLLPLARTPSEREGHYTHILTQVIAPWRASVSKALARGEQLNLSGKFLFDLFS